MHRKSPPDSCFAVTATAMFYFAKSRQDSCLGCLTSCWGPEPGIHFVLERKKITAKLENYSNKILFFIFQSELVSWLAEEMSQQGLDVDQLDIASNSPLHLAAKHGCTTSAAALLHFGTQVTLKVTYLFCFIYR